MSFHGDVPEFELVDFASWDDWFADTLRTSNKTGVPPGQFLPPERLVEKLGNMPTPPWGLVPPNNDHDN
jgi:hypothetical protein